MLWFAFNKRSLTSRKFWQWLVMSCDLLSTNDLWHQAKYPSKTNEVVICFQQTIFDITNPPLTHKTVLWFAFNKRSLTSTKDNLWNANSCDLLSTNDLWHRYLPILTSRNSCDLLSTNDLWHLWWSAHIRRDVVICFQQTIFDIMLPWNRAQDYVVICFQQTIFDILRFRIMNVVKVVICFQQTIFDIRSSLNVIK